MDGAWVIDSDARQEDDGHNNINNVLLPEDLTAPKTTQSEFDSLTGGNTAAAVMAGVTPQATTAQLAGNVAKEEKSTVPGGFPETPATEVNELSVNPIPATNGIGNPVKLNPGEPVPDPSTLHSNTVQSTVHTDKEAYEAGASNPVIPNKAETKTADALSVPPVSGAGLIPESSLPMNPPQTSEPGFTIQSAHPNSTTAALAAQVPLESQKAANGVPEVVQESLSKAHEGPEAAANAQAVEEKATVEKELQDKVGVTDGPAAVPAADVPNVVKDSLEKAHQEPEAASSPAVVEEKKEVEQELQQKVSATNKSGEPAPTATAATTATVPAVTSTAAADKKPIDSADISPQTTSPPATAQQASTTTQAQPTVTTGVASGKTTEESKPVGSATQDNSKDKKKKNRASGFFQKLKEKLK